MSELCFKWDVWELPLEAETCFTRIFGEYNSSNALIPMDFSSSAFEMRLGVIRQAVGIPSLVLDTANGDLLPGAGGALTFLFRPARIATLSDNLKYFADLNRISGGVTMPFARGQIVFYRSPKAA